MSTKEQEIAEQYALLDKLIGMPPKPMFRLGPWGVFRFPGRIVITRWR